MRFAQEKRNTHYMSQSVTELPGPGNYDKIDIRGFGKSGTAALITGKGSNKYNENPGPGSYD